jgi:ubiquinone/menaquinone biosynthesis C-methylase UbiE
MHFVSRYLSGQFRRPHGLVGRFAMAPMWNRRNAPLNDAVLEALDLQPGERVIEVGFGGGYLLDRMAAVSGAGPLAGVDASPAMVARAERRFAALVLAGRLDLACAPAEALPHPDGAFAKACTVNSIFYWNDLDRGFSELHRVLGHDGILVVCFTSRASLQTREFSQHGLRLYEADEIGRAFERAGFLDTQIIDGTDPHRTFHLVIGRV